MAEISVSPNRIELESQILCASLRQSWAQEDTRGVIVVAKQLSQLFPDLLPPLTTAAKSPRNLYDFMGLSCNASQNAIVASYIKAITKITKQKVAFQKRDEFYALLDASYILRKPRLRLSHDLIVVRSWLLEQKAIPADGTIDFITAKREEKVLVPSVAELPPIALPGLVNLLQQAQIIGSIEVLALTNQSKLAPEIPIEELILSAGYVSEPELKSLQLAEYLLKQGKITMPQFVVAMYDERTRGIRMAESLQSRGWLEVEVKPSMNQ